MTTLAPYPAYKDSGVEWLDDVPAHWNERRGKMLFQKLDRPIIPGSETVTCFRDGTVTLRRNRRTGGFTEAIQEIGYQGVRRGDLVIHAMDAFAGAVGVSDSDGKCSPVYSVCSPIADAYPEYYARVVREMARNGFIQAQAKGIRERSTDFRFDGFGRTLLPLPPLDEQRVIADFLDGMDARITRFLAARRKMIALLEEQKQAIINQAVTRGLDPDVPLKDSGVDWLGEIPAHWDVLPLKRWLSTRITDGPHETPAFEDSGIDFVSAEAMVGGKIDFNKRRGFISEALHREYTKKLHPEVDDIFMCKSGATTGKLAIVDDDREFSVWSPLALIKVDRTRVLPRLLFRVLHATYVQEQVQQTWSYGTQPNLSMASMARLVIALPNLSAQELILAHIERETSSTDALIARHRREIELMQEYRTRLISDVVTGKLDVRGVELSAVEEVIGEEIEAAMEEEIENVAHSV